MQSNLKQLEERFSAELEDLRNDIKADYESRTERLQERIQVLEAESFRMNAELQRLKPGRSGQNLIVTVSTVAFLFLSNSQIRDEQFTGCTEVASRVTVNHWIVSLGIKLFRFTCEL